MNRILMRAGKPALPVLHTSSLKSLKVYMDIRGIVQLGRGLPARGDRASMK